MRYVLAGSFFGAVAVLGAAWAPATAASATTVQCGDTITANVVLTKNLTCRGDGLRAGAPGLTIDLNGLRLSGSGGGIGLSGNEDLRVTNGTIRGFSIGVQIGSGALQLSGVKVFGNGEGVQNRYGVVEADSSTFDSNITGIRLTSSVTVTRSTFRNNRVAVDCDDSALVVTGSRFTANTTSSITAWHCAATIHDNEFVGGEVAVEVQPLAWALDIQRNTFSKATIGLAISEGIVGKHEVVGNVFKGNAASGLAIQAIDLGATLMVTGNTFTGNGNKPGSYVDPSGNQLTSGVWANLGTFTDNRAISNAGHGIEADQVTDGGGNTASLNRVDPQCVGVVCAP